jgi:hypothetical protein
MSDNAISSRSPSVIGLGPNLNIDGNMAATRNATAANPKMIEVSMMNSVGLFLTTRKMARFDFPSFFCPHYKF